MPTRYLLSLALLIVVAALLVNVGAPAGHGPVQAAPPPPPETVIIGVGDILLGRQLGEEMARADDYSIAFRNIRETLTAGDITFGNLEGPFCERGPYPANGMIFRFRPRAVESLKLAGLDVVSVANNHFGDGGEACMAFSLEHLRGAGILPAGAGRDYEEAHTAAILERNGVRFAFLAFTYAERNDHPGSKRPVVAGRDVRQLRRDVAAARERADVVIVSLHDGAEYTQRIARETEEFARAAIETGAAAVFGHHPHVPQRVEHYRDGWIFYSLGNFVFQQNSPPAVRNALIARLTFSGAELVRVEAVPAIIEWFAQPRLATQQEAAPILKSIGLADPLLRAAKERAAAEKQGTPAREK
jgi:poly-gamma-glutamate synthesis protein (capsule biosynthesis protein)